MDLFIQNLFDPSRRFFFCAWVFVVIFSTVLHELGHGWTAMRHGDQTPVEMGRMTGNPLVHMGPWSLLALAVVGIAWGQMPIDHSRLRGRYAEAWVALAGPAVNLLIAAACIVALGLVYRFETPRLDDPTWLDNLHQLLRLGAAANLLLCAFNLLPVPPLDGSHVLANLNRPYALWIDNPSNHGTAMIGFFIVFIVIGTIWPYAFRVTDAATLWIAAVGH